MLSWSIGPFALPVAPLLLAAALWLAGSVSDRVAARAPAGAAATPSPAPSDTLWLAALWGLLGARLLHLATHAASYAATPWAALDLRDGGWHALGGALLGVAWLLWRSLRRHSPGQRRALAIGVLTGLLAWSLATAINRPGPASPADALRFQPLSGGPSRSLAELSAGRPTVVNLWASWCGPCRQEMPTFAAAQQRHSAVHFVFVNQGESAEVAQAYLRTLALPPQGVLLDARAALGPAVGSVGLPTTLFYDAQGRLLDAHFGVLNAAALDARVRSLLR